MAARQGLKGLNPKAAEYFPRNQVSTYYAPLPSPPVNPHLQPHYFPKLQTLSQPICRYSNPNTFPIPPEHKTHGPRNPNAVFNRRRRAGNKRGDRWQQRRKHWRPMLGKEASCTNNSVERNLNKCEGNENHDDHHRNVKSCNYWRKKMMKRYSEVLPVGRDGNNTTVMIRNIPNKYNRDLLVAFLDNHCLVENRKSGAAGDRNDDDTTSSSAFDFLYLPIDFQTGHNKGYAFVNFTNPKAVWKFFLACHREMWNLFQSTKIREIAYAKIQGKKALEEHFENMGFPCESEEVLPVCFSPARDGSEKVVEQRTVGRRMCSSTGGHVRNAASP